MRIHDTLNRNKSIVLDTTGLGGDSSHIVFNVKEGLPFFDVNYESPETFLNDMFDIYSGKTSITYFTEKENKAELASNYSEMLFSFTEAWTSFQEIKENIEYELEKMEYDVEVDFDSFFKTVGIEFLRGDELEKERISYSSMKTFEDNKGFYNFLGALGQVYVRMEDYFLSKE